MKKVNCIVMYRRVENGYKLESITAKHKISIIPLYNSDKMGDRVYNSFAALYDTVLNYLKANNMYVAKWIDFGATWYDVVYINLDTCQVEQYSYKK